MMAASMGPNFTGHPAAMGHQAVAGHPMGPGMPPNAAQQGAPGGGMPQQFGGHMAVSGPGGQMNPAMMGAMPPSANPHLQHLSPAQQQLFQQQHQQQLQSSFHNPTTMAAFRQQQILQHQQQQARQALMAQQVQVNMGVGGGIPMGVSFNQLNPQQLQQLRGRIGPGTNPQAQAIMAQQLALQQQQQAQQQAAQQAAHNQQMPGGPNQGQPMPMSAQNMAALQQQQHQHQQQQQQQQQGQMAGAGAGGQNQAGGQQQGGQQATGQPQSQPQAQPQQPGQQAQQTPQQTSQSGTPAPSGQQTPAQVPVSAAATQGNPAQQVPGPIQAQQMHPQAQQQMNTAQHFAMQSSLFQQQRREALKAQCLLRLMQLSEHLSAFPGSKGRDDLVYWSSFVTRFFSPAGVFRHSLHIDDGEDLLEKQYEIPYPAIARYFHTYFSSGVKSMQLILDKFGTDRYLPGDYYCIENYKASLTYWYESGSHVVATGSLRAQFDAEHRLELLEFFATSHDEYIARKQVIDAAKPAHMWFKEWHKVNSQDGKQSPEMSKKTKAKQLKSPQTQPPEVLVDLPDSAVNSKGVTEAVHQFHEMVEVVCQMNPLFGFCHNNPGVSPYQALEQYVAAYINGAPPGMNGQPVQQVPRTPSFGQFQMGASPAAVHMNLPGSPHISSPAPGHMQAPGMQLQPSQQGTSSSGPSANTSPASNKRRRPSGVKMEDDGSGAPTPSGPQVNGVQNRPTKPPTPRMAKRVKGNPS